MAIEISVNNLSKRFGQAEALRGLSIHFEAGLLHGLIGPDGAGKTTLLRLVDGLLKPSAGEICFRDDGQPVPFERVRPAVAYMPSRASLYPDLSIEEHLLFFKNLYSLDNAAFHARRDELLAITRLEKFRDRKISKLSGGMYKKVGLMCALLQSPRVLLLDEPTNGVDPISRREFWELLYRLAADRITVLISTAYMDEAERCARVHLLNDGRLLNSGIPHALLAEEKAGSFEELFLRKDAAL